MGLLSGSMGSEGILSPDVNVQGGGLDDGIGMSESKYASPRGECDAGRGRVTVGWAWEACTEEARPVVHTQQ